MPIEPRLFLKTAMVYLVLTFVAGVVLAVAEASGHAFPEVIAVEHGHAGFVGWLVNVVLGVALWMFPLDTERFPQSRGRYPVRGVVAAYLALNVGLPLRLVAEPWLQLGGANAVAATMLVIGALLQLVAIAVAAAIVWTRIKAPSRPAPGVR